MSPDKRVVIGTLVLLFAAVAVLGTAGCISADTGSHAGQHQANNVSWYNYDITNSPLFATVNHTYDPKDNFYAYANAEQIKKKSEPGLFQLLFSLMDSGLSKIEKANMKLAAMFDTVSKDSSATGTEADLI
ncbi:MAG TPA: hypothetical protein O0X50_01895, partial [Methanocorpusculum sp.]|nr:hypothetical protein [Methanocorpusculum sp.]